MSLKWAGNHLHTCLDWWRREGTASAPKKCRATAEGTGSGCHSNRR